MFDTLPDYPQARHLAAALWRREGQARGAALIVGAGVSTMAQTASENTPKPPLWRDLARSLKAKLYPMNPDLAPTDPLRLAQEFVSYFGQAALNAHLREQIADNAWFPSATHKQLLQLPWADVLTTNYDTLLERAAAEVFTPAYDLVKSPTDLVHARQPRIIKLHGSIHDDAPLVLTEEDYRTYPSKNAAMVNLARQVFIENELCLLGFSGDDPNFLQWTGWVRDHLQGAHRKIYLAGVLHLSPSARRVLEERNIAPIDLAPLVQALPKSGQHAAATSLLLEFLELAKPAPAYEWKLSENSPKEFFGADTQAERDRLAVLAKLRSQTVQWREERFQYPGWVVCPDEYRRFLKQSCLSVGQDMLNALDSLEPSEKASFLAEFVWRFRTAFCFPSEEQKRCLEQFVQSDKTVPLSDSQAECALLILTIYRHSGETESFAALVAQMQGAELNTDQSSWLVYERALHARDLMLLDDLGPLLESVDGEDPMWKLRRAALACDLNLWGYARQQWLQAAIDIRRREQADRNSIWVRSRRALLDFVSIIDLESREKGSYSESRVRSIQGRISHCDPWEQVENSRQAIQNIQDARQKLRDEARQLAFSPGAFRLSSRTGDPSIAAARELRRETLRWAELSGIPRRFKNSSLPNLADEALELAPEPSLPWVLLLARGFHGFKDTYLNRNFTRLMISKLPKDIRDKAISKLQNACDYWRKRITRESDEDAIRANQETLGEVMSILGRLLVAADAQTAQQSLRFAFDLAANNREIDWRQYEALGDLFEGSIEALRWHDAHLVLQCISMPLPSELADGLMEHLWPEPAQWLTRFDTPKGVELSAVEKGRVEQLISAARLSGTDRRPALMRLSALLRFGLLPPEQSAALGNALWSDLDKGSPPLPSETPFRRHFLRNLPAPESVDVIALVRQRVFAVSKYGRPKDDAMAEMIAAASASDPLLPSSSSATEWLDDYLLLHPRLRIWLEGSSTESPDLVRFRRNWLGMVVGRALVPAMEISQLTIERLSKLLELMEEINSESAVIALPYFAVAHPSEVVRLVYRVQSALLGAAHGDVASGAEAVRIWLCKENLRACLSADQISHLQELLLAALMVSSDESKLEVVKAAHAVLAKNLDPAKAGRLVKATQVLLKRTQPDRVRLGTDGEAFFSLVRAEVLRMAKTLLDSGHVTSDELQAAVINSSSDPLPEIRFALVN